MAITIDRRALQYKPSDGEIRLHHLTLPRSRQVHPKSLTYRQPPEKGIRKSHCAMRNKADQDAADFCCHQN